MTPTAPPPATRLRGGRASRGSGDRGVSEVISFIITFSIVTMMIAVLYTGGTVSMDRIQSGNQIQNAQSVFLAMDDSFGELQEGQAPKRAGALDLDVGASLSVVNESSIDVTVHGPDFSRTLVTRSLEYRLGDRSIAYETGGIFRTNDGDSVMVGRPPDVFCSPASNGSVVSIVTLVSSDGGGVASGTATVTGIQRSTKLLYPTDRDAPTAVENVSVNVSSPRRPAWNRHLESAEGWTDDDNDGAYTCESADRVFLRQTVVEVRIQH